MLHGTSMKSLQGLNIQRLQRQHGLPYSFVIPASAFGGNPNSISSAGYDDGDLMDGYPLALALSFWMAAFRMSCIGSTIEVRKGNIPSELIKDAGAYALEETRPPKKGEEEEEDEEEGEDITEEPMVNARRPVLTQTTLDRFNTKNKRKEADKQPPSPKRRRKASTAAASPGSDGDQDNGAGPSMSESDDDSYAPSKASSASGRASSSHLSKASSEASSKSPPKASSSGELSGNEDDDEVFKPGERELFGDSQDDDETMSQALSDVSSFVPSDADSNESFHMGSDHEGAVPVHPSLINPALAEGAEESGKKEHKNLLRTKVFGGDRRYKVRFYLEVLVHKIPSKPETDVMGAREEFHADELNARIIDLFGHDNVAGVIIWAYVVDPLFDLQEAMYKLASMEHRQSLRERNEDRKRQRGQRRFGSADPTFNNHPGLDASSYESIAVKYYMSLAGCSSAQIKAFVSGKAVVEGDNTPINHFYSEEDNDDSRLSFTLESSRRTFHTAHWRDPRLLEMMLTSLRVCPEQLRGRTGFDQSLPAAAMTVTDDYFLSKPYLMWTIPYENMTMEKLGSVMLPHFAEIENSVYEVNKDRRIGHIGTVGESMDALMRANNIAERNLKITQHLLPPSQVQARHLYVHLFRDAIRNQKKAQAELHLAIELLREHKKHISDPAKSFLKADQIAIACRTADTRITELQIEFRKARSELGRLVAHAEASYMVLVTSRKRQSLAVIALVDYLAPYIRNQNRSLAHQSLCMCLPQNLEETENGATARTQVAYERILGMSSPEVVCEYNRRLDAGMISDLDKIRFQTALASNTHDDVARIILLESVPPEQRSRGTRLSHFGNFMASEVFRLTYNTGIIDSHALIVFLKMAMNSNMIPIDFRVAYVQEGSGGIGKSYSIEFATNLVAPGLASKAGTSADAAMAAMDHEDEDGAECYLEGLPELSRGRDEQSPGNVSHISLLTGIGDKMISRERSVKFDKPNGMVGFKRVRSTVFYNKTLFVCMNISMKDEALKQRFYQLPMTMGEKKNKKNMATQVFNQMRTNNMDHITTPAHKQSAAVFCVGTAMYIELCPEVDLSFLAIQLPTVVSQLSLLGMKDAQDPRGLQSVSVNYITTVVHKAVWLAKDSELSFFTCNRETYQRFQEMRKNSVMRITVPEPDHPGIDPRTGTMAEEYRDQFVFPDLLTIRTESREYDMVPKKDPVTQEDLVDATGAPILEAKPRIRTLVTRYPRKGEMKPEEVCYLPTHPLDIIKFAAPFMGPDWDAFAYMVTTLFNRVYHSGLMALVQEVFRVYIKMPVGLLRAWIRYNDELMVVQNRHAAAGEKRDYYHKTHSPDEFGWNLFSGAESAANITHNVGYFFQFRSEADTFLALPEHGAGAAAADGTVPDYSGHTFRKVRAAVNTVEADLQHCIPVPPDVTGYTPSQDLADDMSKVPTSARTWFDARFLETKEKDDDGIDVATCDLNYISTGMSVKGLVQALSRLDSTDAQAVMKKMTAENLIKAFEGLTQKMMRVPVLPRKVSSTKVPNEFNILGYMLHPDVLGMKPKDMHSMRLAKIKDEKLYLNIFLGFHSMPFMTRFVFSKLMNSTTYPHKSVSASTSPKHPAVLQVLDAVRNDRQTMTFEDPDYMDPAVKDALHEAITVDNSAMSIREAAYKHAKLKPANERGRQAGGAVIQEKHEDIVDIKTREFNVRNGFTYKNGDPYEDNIPKNIDRAIRKQRDTAFKHYRAANTFQWPKHAEVVNGKRTDIDSALSNA